LPFTFDFDFAEVLLPSLRVGLACAADLRVCPLGPVNFW